MLAVSRLRRTRCGRYQAVYVVAEDRSLLAEDRSLFAEDRSLFAEDLYVLAEGLRVLQKLFSAHRFLRPKRLYRRGLYQTCFCRRKQV